MTYTTMEFMTTSRSRKLEWLQREAQQINDVIKVGAEIIYTDYFSYNGDIINYKISEVKVYKQGEGICFDAYYDDGVLAIKELDFVLLFFQALGIYW